MVLSEAEGLLSLAIWDLETATASSDPNVFRESAWGFWLQQRENVDIGGIQCLGQLTPYAVQFRHDAELQPLGLDRAFFLNQVRQLLIDIERLLHRKTN